MCGIGEVAHVAVEINVSLISREVSSVGRLSRLCCWLSAGVGHVILDFYLCFFRSQDTHVGFG